jgi:2-polyprenyl-3-methyl-5-hydroxy-6-metoxy-1,4-benzoquinol methylase
MSKAGIHLTNPAYWDRNWAERSVAEPLDPHAAGLNGVQSRCLHRLFARLFERIGIAPNAAIVEAGCGGSAILPYFKREFGLRAEGLDNSPVGIDLCNAIARKSGVETPVYLADIFELPAHLRGRYDIVFSYGLAEHFNPTTLILEALAGLARPGGYVLTLIPNMRGALGVFQKLANPDVYAIHVPLTALELSRAHEACGLRVIEAGYFMTANFSAINFQGSKTAVAWAGPRLAAWTSKVFWLLERLGMPEIPNPITSPYAYVLAQTKT